MHRIFGLPFIVRHFELLSSVDVAVGLCRLCHSHSDMVENLGVDDDISRKSYSVRLKHCTFGLQSAILNFGGSLTTDNVAVICVTIGSGIVKISGQPFNRWNFGDASFR